MDVSGLYQDAIGWARRLKVVLPAEYYGLLRHRARAAAFSISGISSLDQIDEVKRSLEQALADGESFGRWKQRIREQGVSLDLPDHRIENIFRTNIQGWYAAGRCRAQAANADHMPYLMYSAINDSRTRPAHAAMHGHIARIDDPIWKVWMPPAGFYCRCTTIQMTAEEAERRGGVKPFPGVSPDPGWDYSVCESGPEEGARRAIADRSGRCGRGLSANAENTPTDQVSMQLSAREPWWCRHPSLIEAVAGYQLALSEWGDRERMVREAMGDKRFDRHAEAVHPIIGQHGLSLEQGVMLRAYTDRSHRLESGVELYTALNALGRSMVHLDEALPYSGDTLYRTAVMLLVLDDAIEALPPTPGIYWRGVSLAGMPAPLRQRWKDAHRKGRVVQYNGYTSVTAIEGSQYGGEHQAKMYLESPRDIRPFAVDPEEGEHLLPRGVQLEYRGIQDGYRVMYEQKDKKSVKQTRNFAADEEEIAALIRGGYTRERAIEILHEMKETTERWARERSQPITKEKKRWWKNMLDRMQAEATAGLTK